jgi:hypothetical protein
MTVNQELPGTFVHQNTKDQHTTHNQNVKDGANHNYLSRTTTEPTTETSQPPITATATTSTATNSISTTKRNITFAFIFITISLSSGLVYGWPALRRNLLLYENSSLTETQLGLIFTVGGWSTLGSRLLVGILRDGPFGTRLATIFSLMAVSGGCAGMAFASKDHVTTLAISYFLVGFGSGTQLCLQPVAGWFEEGMQGVVLASTSGAFQVSGLVFWVLVEFVSRDRRVSLGGFALVLCFVAVVSWRVLPRGYFVSSSSSTSSTSTSLNSSGENSCDGRENDGSGSGGGGNDEEQEQVDPTSQDKDEDDEEAEDDDDSNHDEQGLVQPKQQNGVSGVLTLIKTWEYTLLLTWFSLQLIPLQYYVATIGFQLERKGDDTGRYISLFPIMYASAAIFAPVFGKIADLFGLGIAQAVANALSIISLLILSADRTFPLSVQVLGMACYGLGRMSVFGTYFSNIGKRFGYRYYGTLAGVGLIVSALVSLFQYPLIAWAAGGNERWVNVGCAAVLTLEGFPYCVWLYYREKRGCKPVGE